jgi:tRNA uridine 5-carboxymethylaminomethyl modification enzyme
LIKCFIAHTNSAAHDLIWQNINKLPELYGYDGNVVEGPRYCPSIEKKLIKFPDRD